MSYLGEPFKHDLFVSYSHGAFDGSGESNLKKWSKAFVSELEGELRQHPKFRELKIFVDQDYRPDQGPDPMMALTRPLREEICAAGLLAVLMSPHYLRSKWCADERDWWIECQAKHGLDLDGQIAIARIWPTEDPWPEAFVDERGEPLIGFTFYDLQRAETRPQPYDWPDPIGAKGAFRRALLDMVGRIWQHLTAVKEQLEERRRRAYELAVTPTEGGRVVYLHARDAHADAWELVRNVLEAEDFIVMPVELAPVSDNPTAVRQMLERRLELLMACDGLFLLGTEDAWTLDADLIDVGRKDRTLSTYQDWTTSAVRRAQHGGSDHSHA